MASSFSWLDYSDSERRRFLDVVRTLNERETRDELGVGTVRDGLADLLAPGVSTLHTRARYFFFIPWLYKDLERRLSKRKSATKEGVAREARQQEIQLIEALRSAGETEGVIGASAGKALQRLPSSVYWSGLAEWGLRLCPWSIDNYHYHLAVRAGRAPLEDADHAEAPNWKPGMPEAPARFPERATMGLQPREAEYLQGRIRERHPHSLLGELVVAEDSGTDLNYPWEVLEMDLPLSPWVTRALRHARAFSLMIHGAVLLYNLLLAEAAREIQPEDWVANYRQSIADWAANIQGARNELNDWDREDFWYVVSIGRPTVNDRSRRFIDAWFDRVFELDDPGAVADDSYTRQLVRDRERALKKAQARLTNQRLLEAWRGASGAGMARLDFRWPNLRAHLRDIRAGLRSTEAEELIDAGAE